MKRYLLLASTLFLGVSLNAQFTFDNSPAIGDGTTLYLMDSLAPSYSEIVGEGVTWDYSNYGGYAGETRAVTIFDATETEFHEEYPGATAAMDLEGMLLTFYSNNEDERISQGFVFSEPSFGDVVVTLDEDPQTLYEYPFDFGDGFDDTYAGSTEMMGMPAALSGSSTVSVDGKGTLILAENEYEDVLRYRIADVGTVESLIGPLELVRTQYEYYDHSDGNLPVFVYSSITIYQQGGTEPFMEMFVVMGKDQPAFTVGLEENVLAQAVVYPNPATDVLTINLPASVEKADVIITDALGREVYKAELGVTNTIDVSTFNKGTYSARISNGDYVTVKNIVVK